MIESSNSMSLMSLCVYVCVSDCVSVCVSVGVNIHAYVLDNHGEVLKRWQLMGNQRKQRPWHCGTCWRLTLLSHTHKHTLRHTHADTYESGEAVACYFEPSCHQRAYNYRDTRRSHGGIALDDQITDRTSSG